MSRSGKSIVLGLTLVLAGPHLEARAQVPVHTALHPQIVRRADGERRYLSDGRFMLLKVGPVATGASYLFMGYEDLPPGSAIPEHEHEVDEEIIIVHRGRVRAIMGRDSTEAVAGDAIFLPPRSHISVRALGSDTASIFFVFPRASVERCFEFTGRGEGEATPRKFTRADTAEALRTCQMTYY
jgi:quercetin dioxygenase-like cupin family protein